MEIPLGRVVTWRTAGHGASSSERLLLATVTSAFAGRRIDGAVLARCDRRSRVLEIACVGGQEIVGAIAPIAAGFAAEVIVEHLPADDMRGGRAALRRGFVVVAGRLRPGAAGRLAHASA